MKQLKFRVWDKIEKVFVSIQDYGIFADGVLFGYLTIDSLCSLDKKEFEIQQFTGVLDKNGKEVYEGDIIGGLSELVYLMSGAKSGATRQVYKQIIWSDKHNGWAAQDLGSDKIPGIGGINISLQFYTVVGNIFELPPELKESQKPLDKS